MFPIQDSVPSRSVPVVTRALILINAIVFFFELSLPQASVEQLFYLFGIVPARFTHPDWAAYVGFPVDSYWPFLTHQFLHGGWLHIIFNMWTLWIFGDNVVDRMGALSCWGNAVVGVVLAEAPARPTGRIRSRVGLGAASSLKRKENENGYFLVVFHAFGTSADYQTASAGSVAEAADRRY